MDSPVDNGRTQALPAWLAAPVAYEPLADHAGFLRKNVLSLTAVLLALRSDPQAGGETSSLDQALACVSPALRLLAALTLLLCTSLARNMAFVWVVLVGWLLLLAGSSARRIRTILTVSVGAALVALLVNLPALLLGQTTAPLRMAAKTLATTGVVAALAMSVGAEGLLGALRALRLPRRVVVVLDLAVRDVVLLGESAVSLSEALALRSVGNDRTKTASAAGVMGVVFVRAHTMATARSEAMTLRGYDGQAYASAPPASACAANAANGTYALALACVVVLFAYLELTFL